jgi:hypothetical protein
VHNPDGSLALDTFWWRHGFVELREDALSKTWQQVTQHTTWARRRIGRMKIRGWVEAALRRYSAALDVTDWETAFAKLWSLLEVLTITAGATYDVTVRRALFVQRADRSLQRQKLHHLRDFRNAIVHADSWSPDSEVLLCHLKKFVDDLLVFVINRGHYFASVDDLAQFLDLPHSRRLLLKGVQWMR